MLSSKENYNIEPVCFSSLDHVSLPITLLWLKSVSYALRVLVTNKCHPCDPCAIAALASSGEHHCTSAIPSSWITENHPQQNQPEVLVSEIDKIPRSLDFASNFRSSAAATSQRAWEDSHQWPVGYHGLRQNPSQYSLFTMNTRYQSPVMTIPYQYERYLQSY